MSASGIWMCTVMHQNRVLRVENHSRTSSVLGGKNSKEKKVLPALMDSFILSTTFIIAGARGSYSTFYSYWASHGPLVLPRSFY